MNIDGATTIAEAWAELDALFDHAGLLHVEAHVQRNGGGPLEVWYCMYHSSFGERLGQQPSLRCGSGDVYRTPAALVDGVKAWLAARDAAPVEAIVPELGALPAPVAADVELCGCECGTATGEACGWTGPRSETVLVEWMPEYLRASHEAAGNRGRYPGNGAVRFRAERACAALVLRDGDDWARVVEDSR